MIIYIHDKPQNNYGLLAFKAYNMLYQIEALEW